MTLFSVIIPTCHRNQALTRCLETLAPGEQEEMVLFDSLNPAIECSNAYEVIVTDDGSQSTVERMLREVFPWTAWVTGPKRGAAANRNHGAKEANGDWLVFVDDDCIPEAKLLAAYARASIVGDCGVLEGRTFPEGNREAADVECPINTSGGRLWSCNFAIKRLLFRDIGGFDENYTAAMEDIDLQTRLSKAGHRTAFVPEACVKHPWRPYKGVKFLHLKAIDINYYVNKHPDQRIYFSPSNFLKIGLRAVMLDFPRNLLRYKGRGVLRALLFDLVSVSLFINYVVKRDSLRKSA